MHKNVHDFISFFSNAHVGGREAKWVHVKVKVEKHTHTHTQASGEELYLSTSKGKQNFGIIWRTSWETRTERDTCIIFENAHHRENKQVLCISIWKIYLLGLPWVGDIRLNKMRINVMRIKASDSNLTPSSHPKQSSLNALNPNEWAMETTSFGRAEWKGSFFLRMGTDPRSLAWIISS